MCATTKDLPKKLAELFSEDDKTLNSSIYARYENKRGQLKNFITDFYETKGISEISKRIEKNTKCTIVMSAEEVTKVIDELFNNINECVGLYLNGQLSDASTKMYDSFVKDDPNLHRSGDCSTFFHYITQDKLPEEFYRLRASDSNKLYLKKDMFHVPFSLRGKVRNYRFSISGYPCLYIGSSIYGGWEELDRPNIDTFNVVGLRIAEGYKLPQADANDNSGDDSTIRVINLTIPNIGSITHASVLIGLVLRIACTLKVSNRQDFFHAEYIIPQLLLSSIVKRNSETGTNTKFHGICYTSSIYSYNKNIEDCFNDKDLSINYVFPTSNNQSENDLCPDLRKKFKVSEPTSITNERIKNTLSYTSTSSYSAYSSTLFGDLENIIKGTTHEIL